MANKSINFTNIKVHNGSQNNGFEEFCCQLFPSITQAKVTKTERINGAGGDGGVEVKCHLEDGRIIGLQAKYFSKLTPSQWSQIDKSVETMIKNHPDIVEYYVCVPLNRSPAQIKTWETRIKSWKSKATNSSIVFKWIGESELLDCLIRPETSHIQSYWFDCPYFDNKWVVEQTKISINQLHHRYTPKLHQKTQSEQTLNLLMGVGSVIDDYKKFCSDILTGWQKTFQFFARKVKETNIATLNEKLAQFQNFMTSLSTELFEGNITLQSCKLIMVLNDLEEAVKQLIIALSEFEATIQEQKESKPKTLDTIKWDLERESGLYNFRGEQTELEEKLKQYIKSNSSQFLLVAGTAGSGKSHLMASTAESLIEAGNTCLLLIGERFTNANDPKQQMADQLNWQGTFDQLLSCLSSLAELSGKTAYILIDAINETPERTLWKAHLGALAITINQFSNVKLIVSCREDLLKANINPSLEDKYFLIAHHGFDLNFNEAVLAYFNGYQVKTHHQPTLNNEFKNPLFLKTLCEAYQGKVLPQGTLSFMNVIRAWEARIAENIERITDCPSESTTQAMIDIIHKMSESDDMWISDADAKAICKQYFSNDTKNKGLYYKLLSEGFMCEMHNQSSTSQHVVTNVRLQYERFADIRTAEVMLKDVQTKTDWRKKWQSKILPNLTQVYPQEQHHLHWRAQPRLFALGLLLPEKIGIELVECPLRPIIHRSSNERSYMDSFEHDKKEVWNAWLDTLNWREFKGDTEKVKKYFLLWANKIARDDYEIYGKLFEYACIPQHPFNAKFLHKHLFPLSLSERDLRWSTILAYENIENTSDGIVGEFLHWADTSTNLLSEEQVQLALIPLLWLTSSSNRILRNKATDIAIRILYKHPAEGCVIGLCERFFDVNDPYVKERLLAVLCGALPACKPEVVAKIGQHVYQHFWSKKPIEPNIMMRDYAEFIIRFACFQEVLDCNAIGEIENRPNKKFPRIWSEKRVKEFEDNDDYYKISSSLKPESMGCYGDFGRYVMGSAVENFADLPVLLEMIETGNLNWHEARADDKKARRYIWQRVIELGWSPEQFGDFEKYLRYAGRQRAKVERISKKYQWIGLYEYLGLLADSTLLLSWDNAPRLIKSFSELEQRNYNPSIAISNHISQDDEEGWDNTEFSDKLNIFNINHGITLPKVLSDEERKQWVVSDFEDITSFLSQKFDGKSWICLLGNWDTREAKAFGEDSYGLSTEAKMSQWVHIRAMTTPTKGHQKILQKLRAERFFGNGIQLPEDRQAWISEYPWKDSFTQIEKDCAQNDSLWRNKSDEYSSISLLSCDIANILLPNPEMYRGVKQALGFLSAPILNPENNTIEIRDLNNLPVFVSVLGKNRILLVEQDSLLKWLSADKLTFFWCGLSEKMAYNYSKHKHLGGVTHQGAIYKLQSKDKITGGFIDEQYEHALGAN